MYSNIKHIDKPLRRGEKRLGRVTLSKREVELTNWEEVCRIVIGEGYCT